MKDKLIYVADDEQKIRDLIKAYLLKENYKVETFCDGESILKKFYEKECDMLIIDIMMPEMDGYTLCKEIRKISDVPTIIVSAKDEEIDRILGLELGSDDYISKPFSPRELVVRVKNIFKRVNKENTTKQKSKSIICCDIEVLPEERIIKKDNTQINFTAKEYDLIYYFIKNKNKVFTREQLINCIWGYDYIGDTRPVDDLVKRIRKKLLSVNSQLKITTVWGYGYKISE